MKWMLALLLAIGVILAPKNALSEQKKVVVIDTGLDLSDPRFSDVLCKSGHRDFTGQGIADVEGHGTFVAGLISHGVRDSRYCMVIVKFYHKDGVVRHLLDALRYSLNLKPKYINISGGGTNPIKIERAMIAANPKVRLIVAAGNDGKELLMGDCFYPACYVLDNITVVGGLTPDGRRAPKSNWGSVVNAWEQFSVRGFLPNGKYGKLEGTSMSTGIHTSRLIKNELD